MADRSHRWSEVIPPQTALTFAAIWDPEEGLVTFSGCELLNSDVTEEARPARDMPLDATEARSQIITIDGLSLPFSSGMLDTAGLPRANRVQFSSNALDEAQSMLDPYMRYLEARRAATQGGVDGIARRRRQRIVPLDWSQLRNRLLRPFGSSPQDCECDCEDFDEDLFEEAPRTACTATSAPVLVHLNLRSAFSMTTTSTTGYVDIETPSVYSQDGSETWSTLHESDPQTCPNRPMDTRRRLRKQRPLPGDSAPASPDEVLARTEYNFHARSPTECSPCKAEQATKGLPRLRSLPKISTKVSRGASPCTAASETTTVVPLPFPAPPLPRMPPCPSGEPTLGRTLRKPKSMTKLVREGVERLARCHGNGRCAVSSWRTDEWEHVHR
ncbi:hypothetical protein PsYK624_145690 [Phanerochaete sordida]|uniref:Uncharacterized protein n=1 Tax=Phanerochaete sordida TaxID=48140 RepID=A0A9P3GP85_9APHY|nr:hypothetical protein PsYK624_145690 [Phanerochaete sordida]